MLGFIVGVLDLLLGVLRPAVFMAGTLAAVVLLAAPCPCIQATLLTRRILPLSLTRTP